MKLSLIATMVMMMSCAAARTAPEKPWSIGVTSSGGFAGKGAGSYLIKSDGEITVTTMANKTCTFHATDEELTRFRELLVNAKPDAWKEHYVPEENCCDRFSYEMTIDEAGKTHKVQWIDEPAPMPKDLEALTNAMVGMPPSLRVTYGGKCS